MSQSKKTVARREILTASLCAIGGIGAGVLGAVLLGSLRPTRESLAATLERHRQVVDISALAPGEFKQIDTLAGPVLFFRRTQEQLRDLESFEGGIVDSMSVASQQPTFSKNRFRSKEPELLVVQPICTHLPFTLSYFPKGREELGADWRGGFLCPSCNSKFDLAGRVFKGMPAPTNLRAPVHRVVSKNEILIGLPNDTL